MYRHIRWKTLALHLYSMGFHNLDEYDQYGRTPLTALACRWREDHRYSLKFMIQMLELAEWYLLHGANPLRSCRDHGTNALLVAAFCGTYGFSSTSLREYQYLFNRFTGDFFKEQVIDPVVLNITTYDYRRLPVTEVLPVLSPLVLLLLPWHGTGGHDDCHCKCSSHGCTVTTKFLEGMMCRNFGLERQFQDSLRLYEASALLYNWYNIMTAAGLSTSRTHEKVKRWIGFNKLDLTHTCCRLKSDKPIDSFRIQKFSTEDVCEIQEEEEEISNHLDDMLQQPSSD